MQQQRLIESFVGLFLLFAMLAAAVLAFKVSGLTSLFPEKSFTVTAAFTEVGGLKVRSQVKISGVQIGEVSAIKLDPVTFKAIVKMKIWAKNDKIPSDSSAGILTAGLLGDNYIAFTPMYADTYLKEGSEIQSTHSAMVLEKLIGQFIYKMGSGNKDNSTSDNNLSTTNAKGANNANH